jgi:Uma2 family endonuclease
MVTLNKSASVTYHWPPQGEWTYDDYARLPDDGWRYEVIRGELHMSPAPNVNHQRLGFLLAVAIHSYVEQHGLGRVYEAPIDVILEELATPVQPDVLYIRNENLGIVGSQRIEGTPDLIIEVLSPGNFRHDRRTKYRLYAEAGVKEFWIVDPEECVVDVYALRGNAYVPFGHYVGDGVIQSELLPDLRIPLTEICGR